MYARGSSRFPTKHRQGAALVIISWTLQRKGSTHIPCSYHYAVVFWCRTSHPRGLVKCRRIRLQIGYFSQFCTSTLFTTEYALQDCRIALGTQIACCTSHSRLPWYHMEWIEQIYFMLPRDFSLGMRNTTTPSFSDVGDSNEKRPCGENEILMCLILMTFGT